MSDSVTKPPECPLGHPAEILLTGVYYCRQCDEVLTGPERAWHSCPLVRELAVALLDERKQKPLTLEEI